MRYNRVFLISQMCSTPSVQHTTVDWAASERGHVVGANAAGVHLRVAHVPWLALNLACLKRRQRAPRNAVGRVVGQRRTNLCARSCR